MKWHNLEDTLNGNPPPDKAHLGHLWDKYHSKKFHPHYVILFVGSNDVDNLGTYCNYLRCVNKTQESKQESVAQALDDRYYALVPKIESFLCNLQLHIPGCIIRYIPIVNRPW